MGNPDPEYGKLLLLQFLKHADNSRAPQSEQMLRLYSTLVQIISEYTDASGLQFHTLFSRMAYIGTSVSLPAGLLFNLHFIRRNLNAWLDLNPEHSEMRLQLIRKAGADLISAMYGFKLSQTVEAELSGRDIYQQPEWLDIQHIDQVSCVLLRIDEDEKMLHVLPEHDFQEKLVRYDVPGKNDVFRRSIDLVLKNGTLPFNISLLDIEVHEDGHWIPSAIVLQPDYLVDVTAVADSLTDQGVSTLAYMLRKYLPVQKSGAIMLGNVANYFLDELIGDHAKTFKELCSKLFAMEPLVFAAMGDDQVKKFLKDLEVHFLTIRKLAGGGFQQLGIDPGAAVLEPTFYSDKHGLQGRLDLFYPGDRGKGAIVELKSGKVFKPNKYGLNQSHYLQTLLYELLVSAVYGGRFKPVSYILYSREYDNPMRFAPVVRAQQYEALAARNELLGIEWQLAAMDDEKDPGELVFSSISPDGFPGLFGFLLRDVLLFERIYGALTDLEKRYFNALSGLTTREHHLAKIGLAGKEGMEGQAALWQKGAAEKAQGYEIYTGLEIIENHSHQDDPLIYLRKSGLSNDLANFRVGDIVVLYPQPTEGSGPTGEQLIKCSIVEMDQERICVRLRARQTGSLFFEKNLSWNLEQDVLDSSFMGMSRALFEWASAPAENRKRVMGLSAPEQPMDRIVDGLDEDLTEEQQEVSQKIINAQDYLLLWGPPGTGKTSKVLHQVIKWLLKHTNETLLVMAYTNRAVDEICEAIVAIGDEAADTYVRIGSRYGAAPEYRQRLLDNMVTQCSTRKELLELLGRMRVVTGTIASIQGKPELFDLINFDRLMVDEASQILEPSMAGLMSRFQKLVLIGDHLQLPAVVTQGGRKTRFRHPELMEAGFVDMRESLFERLLRQCKMHGWDWAYAGLSHQGRMHEEIMEFPNEVFYKGGLRILPNKGQVGFQQAPLPGCGVHDLPAGLPAAIRERRVVFIPSEPEETGIQVKANRTEAELVCRLVQFFREWYEGEALSIGVITPYRAQIATILHVLDEHGVSRHEAQVDTVERFQGGAKDVIIMSVCANHASQLGQIVSLNQEGVDRKLNVALTRARKHLILIGNPEILKLDERYEAFMSRYK